MKVLRISEYYVLRIISLACVYQSLMLEQVMENLVEFR